MTYALCNDGTRIYLEMTGETYSAYSAKCETHGQAGSHTTRHGADRAIYDHAVGSHQGLHSHAVARS